MSHPVPIERKIANGNPGKRAIPDEVPGGAIAPIEEIPAVPDSLNETGALMWVALWTHARTWLHGYIDLKVVERYCFIWQLRDELKKTLDEEGATTLGSQGQTVLHPAFTGLLSVEKQIDSLDAKLGLTPSDRAKLGLSIIQIQEKSSGLEAFMNGTINESDEF